MQKSIVIVILLIITSFTPLILNAEQVINNEELTVTVPDDVTETITVTKVERTELDPEDMEYKSDTFKIDPYDTDVSSNTPVSLLLEYSTIDTDGTYSAKNYINVSDCIIKSAKITIEASETVTIENTTLETGTDFTVRARRVELGDGFDSADCSRMDVMATSHVSTGNMRITVDLDKTTLPPGIDKENIQLYYYDYNASAWLPIDDGTCNPTTNEVTATIDKLTY